jgi:hypothetical protein
LWFSSAVDGWIGLFVVCDCYQLSALSLSSALVL